MKSFRRANSLFTQLLLAFLVPLFIIEGYSIAFFSRGKAAITSELLASAKSNLNYMINEFDARINTSSAQLNQLFYGYTAGARALFLEANARDTSFWLNARDLARRLNDIKNGLGFAEQITLFYPAQSFAITSDNDGFSPDAADFAAELDSFAASGMRLYEYDDMLCFGYAYPSTAYQTLAPRIFARCEISRESLMDLLSAHGAYADYHTLLFNPQTGYVLTKDEKFSPAVLADYQNGGLPESGAYTVIYAASAFTDYRIAQYIPAESLFGAARDYQKSFNLFIFFSSAVMIGYCFLLYRLNIRPIRALVRAFSRMRAGEIGEEIRLSTSSEFVALIDGFNQTSRRLAALIDEIARKEVRAKESELKQLQAQISPHFLYNSFFTLRHMISGHDTDSAMLLSEHLGEYFQYITRNARSDVPLAEEYAHARHYLEIQKLRFAERLEATMEELPQAVRDTLVPRLILQPLLENAFAHGLRDKRAQGVLAVSCQAEDGALCVLVEDNGDSLAEETLLGLQASLAAAGAGETTGLINIHLRLRLRFGPSYGLSAARSKLGGLLIRMSMPLFEESEDRRDAPV